MRYRRQLKCELIYFVRAERGIAPATDSKAPKWIWTGRRWLFKEGEQYRTRVVKKGRTLGKPEKSPERCMFGEAGKLSRVKVCLPFFYDILRGCEWFLLCPPPSCRMVWVMGHKRQKNVSNGAVLCIFFKRCKSSSKRCPMRAIGQSYAKKTTKLLTL